jgi:hypothetical protein
MRKMMTATTMVSVHEVKHALPRMVWHDLADILMLRLGLVCCDSQQNITRSMLMSSPVSDCNALLSLTTRVCMICRYPCVA